MIACEQCTGSRWLGDNQSLGRCVCVTPEAMRELEAALDARTDRDVEICEVLRLGDDAGLLERVTAYVEAVDEVFSDISAGRDKQGEPDELRVAVGNALDYAYESGVSLDVKNALSDYLVSRGDPAVPAGALDNPALERLVSLVH